MKPDTMSRISPLQVVGTYGLCNVRIEAPEVGATWHLRIPEGLTCDEGTFKSDYYPELAWQGPDEQGAIWHAWEADAAELEAMNTHSTALARGDDFVGGLAYHAAVTPSPAGIQLTFSVTNHSTTTFHHVAMFPCLSAMLPAFHDEALTRTYIVTRAGLTPLRDTDRGTGDPIRTHYLVAGMRPMAFYGPWFWGEPSRTTALAGAIARTSADGRFTIATAWGRVCELYHNEDAHHCIHSVPLLGDVAPGGTCVAYGWIVLVEGGPQQALDRLKTIAGRVGSRIGQ